MELLSLALVLGLGTHLLIYFYLLVLRYLVGCVCLLVELLSLALVLGTHLLLNFYLLALPGGLCLFGGTVEPGPCPGSGHLLPLPDLLILLLHLQVTFSSLQENMLSIPVPTFFYNFIPIRTTFLVKDPVKKIY